MGFRDGHQERQGNGHVKTQRERANYRITEHTRRAASYTGTTGKVLGNLGNMSLSAIMEIEKNSKTF